jgi:hypothetical protein
VTLQFPVFVSHHSSAFLQIIFLMVFMIQLTAVLRAWFWASCHSFYSLCLFFSQWSNPGRWGLFMSKSETLLVYSLYSEAIEAVNLHNALLAFPPS